MLLDEIHSPAFTRNQITPILNFIPALSIFITILAVCLIQSSIILSIGYFVFFMDLGKSIIPIIIVLSLLIGSYSLVGMMIAYLVKTKTTSLLVSSFLLIINLFLGGVVYPIERMSSFMAYLSEIIPFKTGISVLQQSIFYNLSLYDLYPKILQLLFIFIFTGILLFAGRKIFYWKHFRS